MWNRKAALLQSLGAVLSCSPVCEKQALFALFQSYKENNVEEQLINKVHARTPGGLRKERARVSDTLCVCVCDSFWAVCAACWATAA